MGKFAVASHIMGSSGSLSSIPQVSSLPTTHPNVSMGSITLFHCSNEPTVTIGGFLVDY